MKKKLAIITILIFTAFSVVATSLCMIKEDVHAAGSVTDNLTVKIGYWGMSSDDYVTKGTFTWGQLNSALPVYEDAFSFFRQEKSGDYSTIIDSAIKFRDVGTALGGNDARRKCCISRYGKLYCSAGNTEL